MPSSLARARSLLAAHPLLDGHNDLPWALRLLGEDVDVAAGEPRLQTDLPRLRTGGVGAQFWSVYVPCSFTGADAVRAVLEQIDLVQRLAQDHPDDLGLADTADDARSVFATGRIASLMGAEGGHCIGNSLAALRTLRRLGVRYLTLTHNLNTDWADAATDEPRHGGLAPFGHDVVRECNRIGMLVDLSHVAATTMHDALATTDRPILFSHSSARAVTDHPRNVPDDVLAALPGNGGVCMVTFVPQFVSAAARDWDLTITDTMTTAGLDPRDIDARLAHTARRGGPACPPATLDDVVGHVEHVREVAGIDHVGLGGDFDGTPDLPVGLADVSRYPALFAALYDRGWSDDDCARLAGGNALRVLQDADVTDVPPVGFEPTLDAV